jgi:twitching motility protein PilJ
MNSSMARISERNLDISEYSEYTQVGVSNLQKSLREVAENLSQFRIEDDDVPAQTSVDEFNSLESLQGATKIYGEEEMSALESEQENRLSV